MNKLILSAILLIISCAGFAQKPVNEKLSLEDHVVSLDGKRFEINADGFPKQIEKLLDRNVKTSSEKAIKLLYEPMHFHFFTSSKSQEKLTVNQFDFISQTPDSISWKATSSSENLKIFIVGKIDFNGFLTYRIKVKALNAIQFSNINFHIPFEKGETKYLAGLGQKDYIRPDTVKWSWNQYRQIKPEFWLGSNRVGLYFSIANQENLTDRAINGWRNQKAGAIQINIKGSSMLADFYTGAIVLKQGDELNFDFNLLLTPLTTEDSSLEIKRRFKQYRKIDLRHANK